MATKLVAKANVIVPDQVSERKLVSPGEEFEIEDEAVAQRLVDNGDAEKPSSKPAPSKK